MSKKVEKESVVVDVDTDVTSVSTDVEVSSNASSRKSSKSKKVSDVALERQISDLEVALNNAKDAIEAAAADNERLADELGISVAENKQLRKELSKGKQDFKRVQADNRANSALVETLDEELTRQKVRNKELLETISRLQERIKQYANELHEKEIEIGALGFDVASRDSELELYDKMGFWKRLCFLFRGNRVVKGKRID